MNDYTGEFNILLLVCAVVSAFFVGGFAASACVFFSLMFIGAK